MALSAFISSATGTRQGKAKGGCIQKGREGWIEIVAANHSVISPRDVASGQATGKRTHKPFCFTAIYDQATPFWYTALCDNESIKEVKIAFFSPNKLGTAGGQGTETLTYEVTLTEAFVSAVDFTMLNNKNPELTRYENTIYVQMVYQKIEGKWTIGNKVWADSWLEPKVA